MGPLKLQASALAGICIVFLAIFVCISSFYSLNHSSLSPASSCSTASLKDDVPMSPVSVLMPAGNCSCTVSYVASAASTRQLQPSFSCNCQEPRPRADLGSEIGTVNSSRIKLEVVRESSCPVCPPAREKACGPKAPWFAQGKQWHFPARFPLCSMDACFNYSRCENAEELLVYTYDLPSPPVRYFSRINASKYWTDNPERACLFLVFLDTQSPWPPWPRDLPHWNGGLNHVLVTFADAWESKGPPPDSIGLASIMGTIVYETTNRDGFDISIPLRGSYAHFGELLSVKALRRKYFATFRGTRYLGERGDGVFRSHDSFRGMHNGHDVVVTTSCKHSTNDIMRNKNPSLGVHCDEDAKLYASYDFRDLMNTTFGIVPAGRQPASYRFVEVLSVGAIPVLIADNYVKPLDTLIQWHKCLLQFPTSEMHRIVATLRAVRAQEIVKRQENCLQFYNEFLKDDETLQHAAMRALKERFLGAIPNFAQVRRRKR